LCRRRHCRTVASLRIPYPARLLIDRAPLGRDNSALVTILLASGSLGLNAWSLRTRARIGRDPVPGSAFRRLSPRFYAEHRSGDATRLNADIGEIFSVSPRSRSPG
jgi:hypothetical protein